MEIKWPLWVSLPRLSLVGAYHCIWFGFSERDLNRWLLKSALYFLLCVLFIFCCVVLPSPSGALRGIGAYRR